MRINKLSSSIDLLLCFFSRGSRFTSRSTLLYLSIEPSQGPRGQPSISDCALFLRWQHHFLPICCRMHQLHVSSCAVYSSIAIYFTTVKDDGYRSVQMYMEMRCCVRTKRVLLRWVLPFSRLAFAQECYAALYLDPVLVLYYVHNL